jgi:glycosyltransferase involved in cell wall biosynthesis
MNKLSVIICTHNPGIPVLEKVLNSLKIQTLPQQQWELIVIDNNSDVKISSWADLSWHREAVVIEEQQLGLINARIRGTLAAQHEILVSVDDDTPLFPDYLENVARIYTDYPQLGIIGGRTVPLFDEEPPLWLEEFYGCLAIRDLGEVQIIEQLLQNEPLTQYPACAPLLIAPRKSCMLAYIEYLRGNTLSQGLGRRGRSLSSGEDNDINLFIYRSGYALGYFPELRFYHIIPEKRMKTMYLSRLQQGINRTWVKVLENYHINPWKKIPGWTVFPRQLKAWFTYRAWKNDANYIRWKGACGTFRGLSEI